jgi:LysR family nitrogen assimilation transcriptional regulator
VEGFRRALPKARLAIVEGLSAHLAEWISTGRVDIGLLHNPEPQPALETTPVLEEPLGLVSPEAGGKAGKGGRKVSPRDTATLAELTRLPLILPERTHAMRKLLETQAALAGHKLNVAPGGFQRAVHPRPGARRPWPCLLTPSALAAFGRRGGLPPAPAGRAAPDQHAVPGRVGAQAGDAAGSAHVLRMLRELARGRNRAGHNKTR